MTERATLLGRDGYVQGNTDDLARPVWYTGQRDQNLDRIRHWNVQRQSPAQVIGSPCQGRLELGLPLQSCGQLAIGPCPCVLGEGAGTSGADRAQPSTLSLGILLL